MRSVSVTDSFQSLSLSSGIVFYHPFIPSSHFHLPFSQINLIIIFRRERDLSRENEQNKRVDVFSSFLDPLLISISIITLTLRMFVQVSGKKEERCETNSEERERERRKWWRIEIQLRERELEIETTSELKCILTTKSLGFQYTQKFLELISLLSLNLSLIV